MSSDRTSSIDRLLAIPRLFTEQKPVWTVEEAARALNLSISTAYRYFQSLREFEYLDEVSGRGYCLGPAFIEFDRSIRTTDPLPRVAHPIMVTLATQMNPGTLIILCRVYRKKVMCVHQEVVGSWHTAIGYERGKPMPIFRGATSKVILANLPWRLQKREFDRNTEAIRAVGMGDDWKSFSARLRAVRKCGYAVSRGEVDEGRMGIAAAIFNFNGQVAGSLSAVCWEDRVDGPREDRLVMTVVAAAARITEALDRAAPCPDDSDTGRQRQEEGTECRLMPSPP